MSRWRDIMLRAQEGCQRQVGSQSKMKVIICLLLSCCTEARAQLSKDTLKSRCSAWVNAMVPDTAKWENAVLAIDTTRTSFFNSWATYSVFHILRPKGSKQVAIYEHMQYRLICFVNRDNGSIIDNASIEEFNSAISVKLPLTNHDRAYLYLMNHGCYFINSYNEYSLSVQRKFLLKNEDAYIACVNEIAIPPQWQGYFISETGKDNIILVVTSGRPARKKMLRISFLKKKITRVDVVTTL